MGPGRRLVFGNVSLSGGLQWGYADETARYEAISLLCLIAERPVIVTEARFGGIVAQPYCRPSRTMTDLRRKDVDLSALRRLDP